MSPGGKVPPRTLLGSGVASAKAGGRSLPALIGEHGLQEGPSQNFHPKPGSRWELQWPLLCHYRSCPAYNCPHSSHLHQVPAQPRQCDISKYCPWMLCDGSMGVKKTPGGNRLVPSTAACWVWRTWFWSPWHGGTELRVVHLSLVS